MIEHDGCNGCMYVNVKETEEPCVTCRSAYTDKYNPEEVDLSEQITLIAEHYGTHRQLNKLMEESAEVIQAIQKHLYGATDYMKSLYNLYNLYGEFADLSIVLEQVIYLLDCKKEVDSNRRYKVERQLKRIEEEVE